MCAQIKALNLNAMSNSVPMAVPSPLVLSVIVTKDR